MADQIILRYDEVKTIARRFAQESEAMAELFRSTGSKVNDLHDKGWIGESSDAFYQEMNERLLPALKRLSDALALSCQTAEDIIKDFQKGENEASEPLRSGSFAEGVSSDIRGAGAGSHPSGASAPDINSAPWGNIGSGGGANSGGAGSGSSGIDSGSGGGANSGGANSGSSGIDSGSGGANSGGANSGSSGIDSGSGGANSGGANSGGANSGSSGIDSGSGGGANSGGASSGGANSGGANSSDADASAGPTTPEAASSTGSSGGGGGGSPTGGQQGSLDGLGEGAGSTARETAAVRETSGMPLQDAVYQHPSSAGSSGPVIAPAAPQEGAPGQSPAGIAAGAAGVLGGAAAAVAAGVRAARGKDQPDEEEA